MDIKYPLSIPKENKIHKKIGPMQNIPLQLLYKGPCTYQSKDERSQANDDNAQKMYEIEGKIEIRVEKVKKQEKIDGVIIAIEFGE